MEYLSVGERLVVKKLIKITLDAGYSISVNDGEVTTVVKSDNTDEIHQAIGTTGDDTLMIYSNKNLRLGHFWLVYGNADWEVLCDYASNPICNAIADKLQPTIDALMEAE